MKKSYLITHTVLSLTLMLGQSQVVYATGHEAYSESDCSAYRAQIREVENKKLDLKNAQDKTLKQLNQEMAAKKAMQAILNSIELLRNRYLSYSSYLANTQHGAITYMGAMGNDTIQQFAQELDRSHVKHGNIDEDLATISINEMGSHTFNRGVSSMTELMAVEAAMKEALGGNLEISELVRDATPTGVSSLRTRVVASCQSATTPSNFCKMIKGDAMTGVTGSSNATALKDGALSMIDRFAYAFRVSQQYDHQSTAAAADTPEQRRKNSTAIKAMDELHELLLSSPINDLRATVSAGDSTHPERTASARGIAVIDTQLGKSLDFKAKFQEKMTAAVACYNQKVGINPTTGIANVGPASAPVTPEQAPAAANPYGTAPANIAQREADLATAATQCAPSASDRAELQTQYDGMLASFKSGTNFTSPLIKAQADLSSMNSFFDTMNEGLSWHGEDLQSWLNEWKKAQAHPNRMHYGFTAPREGANIVDWVNPSSDNSISLENFRAIMVSNLNYQKVEQSYRDGTPLSQAHLIGANDLQNPNDLMKELLKQLLTHKEGLGLSESHCPPASVTSANVNSLSAQDTSSALHECVTGLTDATFAAKKLAISHDISTLNGQITELERTELGIKFSRISRELIALSRTACSADANQKMTCRYRNAVNEDSISSLDYLVDSSGKILSKLSPEAIASVADRTVAHHNIFTACGEETGSGSERHSIASMIPSVCRAHTPHWVDPSTPPRPVVSEYTPAERSRAEAIGAINQNYYPITYLPGGQIEQVVPRVDLGGQLLVGAATGLAAMAPTLAAIPGIQANTKSLVAGAEWQITYNAMFSQNPALGASGFGFNGFMAPPPLFAFPGGGLGGAGGGFNPYGMDAGYGAYLGSY